LCHCGFGGCPSLISNSASAHSLPLALIALISRRRSRTCAKRRRPRQRRLRSLPGQSRRQRRRHARHHCGPQGQPLAPLQPLRREARLDQAAWHTARRRACQTIARNARRRADQRARQQPSGRNLLTTAAPKALAGIRQPERIYNKPGAGGFPLAPWPKPASDWRERAGRKAPTPAHKRAITKTLFGLIIATFRVWLAPPELPRPSSAPTRRARKHPAPWPAITPPALSRRS
jgi:hypothetical protein